MTEEVKACATCKYFVGPQNEYTAAMTLRPEEPRCEHPEAHTKDLIYGKTMCRNERNSKKGCGPKGRLWDSQKPAPKP
jgi:hypothetical protein